MRNINQHGTEGTDKDGHGRKIKKPRSTADGLSREEVKKGSHSFGRAHVLDSPKGKRWKP